MDWIGSLADSMTQYISQAERLYREIATPKTPPPKPAHVATDAKPITLTRNDVIAIATHARTASAEELQYILDHAKELSVTTEERAAISLDLSLIMAHRTRRLNGLRDDPSAKFIAQVLRLAETPYGLVSREWVNEQLADGSSAIQRCKLHRPPSCECWSASRAILYQASANGPKSPEGWAAAQIYSFLEELELASRAEREPNPAAIIAYAGGHSSDIPTRSRWPTHPREPAVRTR
jgi:hypothetical protein